MVSNVDNNFINNENNNNILADNYDNENINNENNNKFKKKVQFNENLNQRFEDFNNNDKENNENNLCNDYYENWIFPEENSHYAKYESKLKKLFKGKSISDIIKILSIIITIFGTLNSFYRPDFPNTLGGLLTLFFTYYSLSKNVPNSAIKILNFIIYGLYGLIDYDLILILLNLGNCFNGIDQYTEGNENGILRWSMFITILNEIIKCGNVYSVKAIKNKIESGKNQN